MILLDPYAARSCPVKTFNNFDPTLSMPEMDESMLGKFQGGIEHREAVLAALAKAPGAVDLRGVEGPISEREAQTVAAVDAKAPVILRPVLPLDVEGHRRGSPDALVWVGDGYWPVKSKPYRVTEKQLGAETLLVSPLSAPAATDVLPDKRFRVYREGALLELTHMWRMMQAHGWAASEERVGIASDEGGEPSIVWVDLTEKIVRTYSNTAGYKLRSPLERYDHEHGFRVHVAEAAQARTGVDDPEPVVRPIRVRECESCAWWSVCLEQMDDDDISLKIEKTPLDVRELQTLFHLGITTTEQLAEADLEAILPHYLPLTQHRDRSEQRLRQAHRRARMIQQGVMLERINDLEIGVPRSPVEVDLDIETADDGSTYLWGCLVTGRAEEPEFVHFSRFAHFDAVSEVELAEEFARWLVALIDEYPDTLIYHYSDYETVHLRRIAARSDDPALARLVTLIGDHFVDLYNYVRQNFVGVSGLGLKVVATKGAGFEWRDEDPGGLQSQSWFADACDHEDLAVRDAARQRVLNYNEDDVRATLAVRNWMQSFDDDTCPAN